MAVVCGTWAAPWRLDVDALDGAELGEDVLDLAGADIHRETPHVHSAARLEGREGGTATAAGKNVRRGTNQKRRRGGREEKSNPPPPLALPDGTPPTPTRHQQNKWTHIRLKTCVLNPGQQRGGHHKGPAARKKRRRRLSENVAKKRLTTTSP